MMLRMIGRTEVAPCELLSSPRQLPNDLEAGSWKYQMIASHPRHHIVTHDSGVC